MFNPSASGRVNRWITRLLSYPGIDENTLAQKKITWISSVAVTTMILVLTVVYHIKFPELRIITYYGLFLVLVFLQGGVITIIFARKISVVHTFIDQILVAAATLVAILKLGGIPYSGGLIFVGLALVFFSLNLKRKAHTVAIYLVYVVTVITAGLLHPYLKVPEAMTPELNISLFVINLLWISGFATLFVLNFIDQKVRLEKLEKDRLKELEEARTRFYTNITHEFRTPLTIISGMTDLIRREPEKWLDEGCEKINRNADILLSLVSRILDLSKLEAGAMPVKMIRGKINVFIGHIVELFRSVADSSGTDLSFARHDPELVMDYDSDKLMLIISNLISNALKYCDSPGLVSVSTGISAEGRFVIAVSDNGPGIPETHLPNIFDRYYRVSDTGTGSGLGLAITRELVKLLGGTITAESVFGTGTEITVTLPVSEEAPYEEFPEPITGKYTEPHQFLIPTVSKKENGTMVMEYDDKPLLLIVEDNPDVTSYLLSFLGTEYRTETASDGQEGLQKACLMVPDLIVSDVMMPGMDGFSLLREVRNDFRTSHIPFVLLTARSDHESRLEGIGSGADAFIPKPFSREELAVQLRSLLNSRKRLRERYSFVHSDPPFDFNFRLEDTFMGKLRDIISHNLADESFGIEKLCLEMGMSRTQLYRKFKSLTDKTLAEYIRSMRLNKARELLINPEISVSEAAYKTGFRNLSHFSRIFTGEFGVHPSDIRKHQSSGVGIDPSPL